MSMFPDGSVAPALVHDVMYTGVKEILTITLENGKKVRCTPEHRFLTTRGYVAVKDFIDDEELICDESNSYAHTALSESMKNTQKNVITHEDRCAHQQKIQQLHPDRMRHAQEAAMRSLSELRKDPEWMKKFSRSVSEAQKYYWDQIEDRKNSRNWSGWTFFDSWDDDRLNQWKLEVGRRTRNWYRNLTPEEHEEWRRRTLEAKRRNGCVNFGRKTKISDGRECDSEFEAEVAQYLLDRGVGFELHKKLRSSTTDHVVFCDFYIDGLYVEVDGLNRGTEFFRRHKYGNDLPFVVLNYQNWKFTIDAMLMIDHIRNGVRVVSVEREPLPGRWHVTYGKTFDIEMDDHYPANFIADGVVSHNSLAYGMITSAEELLKVSAPREFVTAALNTNPEDTSLIIYAKTHDIPIMPPNVNTSVLDYELKDGSIYMPISAIKGVGGVAAREIAQAQPFRDFDDYYDRTSGRGGRKKTVLESLIQLGAFDGVDPRSRFDLMCHFKEMRGEDLPVRNTYDNARIRGSIETKLLGISLSYDPILDAGDWLRENGKTTQVDVLETEINDWVSISGQITAMRRLTTKKGDDMAFVTLKLYDHSDMKITFFPSTWAKNSDMISTRDIVSVRCKRNEDFNGSPSFIAFSLKNHSLEEMEG